MILLIEANKNGYPQDVRSCVTLWTVSGYGGYLSLAYKFPNLSNYIEHVTDEFREIYDIVKHTKPYTGLKVAILNAWG